MLPDSTATDLDQHLSNLVGTPPSTAQMNHQTLMNNSGSVTANHEAISSNNAAVNGIVVGRYNQNQGANDYNLHSSQNGPRSLSDSSQAESPVQDDLLSTNTPNLGGNGGSNNYQGKYNNAPPPYSQSTQNQQRGYQPRPSFNQGGSSYQSSNPQQGGNNSGYTQWRSQNRGGYQGSNPRGSSYQGNQRGGYQRFDSQQQQPQRYFAPRPDKLPGSQANNYGGSYSRK